MLEQPALQAILEALLLTAGKPMTEEQLLSFFSEEEKPALGALRQALHDLDESCESRGVQLIKVANGYRFQVKTALAPWVSKLWEEKPPRYSRALLETLALIAYRQPITRGEIEDIRGVTVSTSIIKTLMEDREWIRVVGYREVPGRPALFATTKAFLDYFGMEKLDQLPSLPEIMSLDSAYTEAEENFIQVQGLENPRLPVAIEQVEEPVEDDEDSEDKAEHVRESYQAEHETIETEYEEDSMNVDESFSESMDA